MVVRNKKTGEITVISDFHPCVKDEKREEVFKGLKDGKYEVVTNINIG